MPEIEKNEKIVELKSVSFSYGEEKVLSGITLAVSRGDYLGIIGPNGAGKTTLLKIILGLLRPDSGSVRLFGEEVSNFKERSKLGYVPQKNNFDANFPVTVYEAALMGRIALRGLFRPLGASDRRATERALESVGMLKYKNRLIGELSGGEQQKVFIARALAGEPEIIFLDEPTTGVDIAARSEFYALLKKLNESGLTLVLISHDIETVIKEVKNIACVDKVLICHDQPAEFLKHSRLGDVFRGEVKIITHKQH